MPAAVVAVLWFAWPLAAEAQQGNAPATGSVAPTEGATTQAGEAPTQNVPERLVSPALGPLAGSDRPITPREGRDVRLGGFGGLGGLGAPYAPDQAVPLLDRPWSVQPRLTLEVLATDNVFLSANDTRSDVITSVTPGITLNVSTPRLLGTISYDPTARFYATYTNQNRVDQYGSGQLLAAVIPGSFYVDMRGSASVVPSGGGFFPGAAQPVSRGDDTQLYAFQVTPYLVHRFGSAATAQIGYSFQYSEQTGNANIATGQPLPEFAAQDYMAHRGFAILRSGEDLGRLALQASVDGTAFVGTGIYDNAHRFLTSVEGRYSITPTIAVLLEGGYENLEYGGTAPGKIEGPIWSVGTRLTPSPDSIVILRYGRRDGFNSLSVNAGIALGGRTDLFASYNERLTSSLGDAQDLLASTTLDALGNPVDSQTGAPVLLVNPFFPVQNALFRTRTATVTLRQSWPRDIFTLSGSWQDRDPVSAAPGTVATPETGGYATFSWAHDLSPRTTTIATVQYGRIKQDIPAGTTDNYYSASAAVVHWLSETLIASVQLAWTRRDSDDPQSGYTETILRAVVRKTF
ncbi:TIGR03016 family PEP-CTERM system-associated outer membrane protein [Neoroseomonas soli]|uniref:TIGR03016 family PEP-CTERM system-associated outer membrane protein n=1 Tax=Neoroseomonas soli TaxID=1081025 RepID=A0A9X9WSN7_9PROT|nr:TIGR03016 family PEP-CTERM system-associated outer membrane protein [Neoroseomonas soli]MBR0670166.1 TIGR03016 family PEP-CTERM system-associated outer membrane protein [Neoroseomonas soli]